MYYFICNNGYIMVGKDKMFCCGGVWDELKLICIKG